MLLLDLKTVLFVVLIGGLASIWWRTRRQRAFTTVPSTLWSVCETLPFGIVVFDPHGVVTWRNAAARHLLSMMRDKVGGDIQLEQFIDGAQTTTQGSGLLHHPLPLRWWRYPLDEHGTLVVLADDSHHQRFMQQQQAFVGQLAHELRTPLTALVAHAEIAGNAQTPELTRRASVATIQHETQRIAHLVRDLLELHRLEVVDDLALQPTNAVLVAEAAVAQTILHAEQQGLHLAFESDAHLPLVLAQGDRLQQVFLNLIDNAIKYCRPNDEIHVRLRAQPDGAQCVVQDTGLGIAPADLSHVTERLYRGRKDVEGSGIGLALVNEILTRHHATLLIESSTEPLTSGTTVCWTLPYAV